MIRTKIIWLPIMLASAGICGCEHQRDTESVSQVVGGTSGALIGAQIGAGTGQLVAVGIGAVVGTVVGGAIAQDAKEIPASPKCNEPPIVRPAKPAYVEKKQYMRTKSIKHNRSPENSRCCREYTHQGYIDGKPVKIHGTAHMKADGTWYVPDSLHANDIKN